MNLPSLIKFALSTTDLIFDYILRLFVQLYTSLAQIHTLELKGLLEIQVGQQRTGFYMR